MRTMTLCKKRQIENKPIIFRIIVENPSRIKNKKPRLAVAK